MYMVLKNWLIRQYRPVGSFLFILFGILAISGFFHQKETRPIEDYGYKLCILLYFLKMCTQLGWPMVICNLLGIIVYDVNNKDLKLRRASLLDPFMSIRVVTRGSYPELVINNVLRNMGVCKELGLDKYVIEVVTDRQINLPKHPKIREVVVPEEYKTKSGARFKARALQYALEDHVNILDGDDWIVHLDEETLLTKSSLIGILNFLYENKHQIGQGLITYGKEEIVNWMTTLADSIRVASDYGVLRFCLKTFHKPLFSFKGSFIVCKANVERLVSFENGVKGSIAEDSYFAIQAVNHGFTFDWIEGEMLEKSPFSFKDFVKQRKRWVQGLYLLVSDRNVKSNLTKKCFAYSLWIWMSLPIQIINSIILLFYPISFSLVDDFICRLNGIIFLYLFMFGAVKSFNFWRKTYVKKAFILIGSLLSIPFLMLTESIAVVWGLFGDKQHFYIVLKNKDIINV